MGEGGGGRRVGQVVRGHVYRLHGGYGAVIGGCDPFLQSAHFGGQRGLVTYSGGHAPQQRGHFAARLGEAEYVVYEQEHVLLFDVPEVLGHGQARQTHAHTRSRGLVHLAVHQRGVFEHSGFLHLVVKIVALTGALAYAGEHAVAVVLGGDVVYKFLDQHGLAHARAAEQADLAALGVGADQVNDLYARLQYFGGRELLVKAGGGTVYGPSFRRFRGGQVVHGLAQQVHYPAQHSVAHGHGDGFACIYSLYAPL